MLPFLCAWLGLLAGLAAALQARSRRRWAVGPPLVTERPPLFPRVIAVAWLALVAVVVAACTSGEARALVPLFLVTVLLTGTVFLALPRGAVVGEQGVSLGWRSAPYSGLQEWRLIGEHLRFRVGGRWHAVAAPASVQGVLRGHLGRESAERESRMGGGSASASGE